MNVLITGITGFSGSHLAYYLLSQKCTIFGTVFDKCELRNIDRIVNQIQTIECDICNVAKVSKIIRTTKPNYIFHFAAQLSHRIGSDNPYFAFKTNVLGTMTLLEAVRQIEIDPVILVPGSSAEFGLAKKNENPVGETNPYRPVSAYAVSKIAQGMTAYRYYLTYGMKIIRTHTFNCIGARQSEEFICSAFAKQIAEIEKGLRPPVIQVRNLDTWRDFIDIRDVVRAYWLAVKNGAPGDVYNICSGHAYSGRQILEKFLSMTSSKIEVRQDKENMRLSDVPFQVGDFTKFRKLTGWQPQIQIEDALKEILDYWRQNVK